MLKHKKLVMVPILFGLVAYLLWLPINQNMLETKIVEAFELANPDSQVTDVNLIREGSVYKAIFKLGGELTEIYIDPTGKYLFPIRSDVSETIQVFKNQKNFFTCLREKETILFGVIGNNYTTAQLQELGSGPYVGLIYFDCGGENTETCVSQNITSAPSWIINQTLYPLSLKVAQVAQLSGCTTG
ncbi:MAG: hypothetical protein GOU98_03215 [Candidatus Altiarchaeota archaeon]|nr:hypothetical protein [Candidatus Altiarchaeota archaeon]